MKASSKNLIFSFLLLLMVAVSCKDDEPAVEDNNIDNRPPAEVVATLTENLVTADSLSTFTDALEAISLNPEDVVQGLTIFAPLNEGIANNSRVSSNAKTASSKEDGTGFTDEELKDHIIKGVLKLSDLADGTVLVSLSGKNYKITKIGDQVWINGVLILPKEVLSSSRETVFAVKSPLSNTQPTDEPTPATTSIEITVWDASQWSPENPKGVLSAAADVVLYSSHEDYTNSNPAYELKSTGEDGKVIFADVAPGTYYIEISKENLSNIFGESEEPLNGLYVGVAADGIFQTQEEIDNAAQQGAEVGSIRWLDANADGILNDNDLVPLPYESVTVSNNNLARIEVLIDVAYEEEDEAVMPELTEGEIAELMDNVINSFSAWHLDLAIIDGLLSDDTDTPPTGANLPGIDNFQFNPGTASIVQIWNTAYANINNLNLILANNPTNPELLANAKALRAYIYLKLTTYFGGLPLHLDYVNNPANQFSSSRSERSEIVTFVITELSEAQDLLPEVSQDKSRLDKISINALLAQAALLVKDYSAVIEYSGTVIYSDLYYLADASTAIADEAIWASSNGLGANLESYFGHATLPYIRLTEMYLMRAEASINEGLLEEAINIMSPLIDRNGATPLDPPLPQEELISKLRSLWKAEMPKEGSRFANLVRWQIAGEILGAKEFTPGKHELLPIPQIIIDTQFHITQNPGY